MKIKPGIFDDGKFSKLEPPEVKAFLYLSTLLHVRYLEKQYKNKHISMKTMKRWVSGQAPGVKFIT